MDVFTRKLGRTLIAGGTLAVGIGGLAKLLNLPHFMDSLSSWTILPTGSHLALTIGIPTIEAGVGIAWCLQSRVARSGWPAILVMAILTVVLLLQLSIGPAPECRCFGQIMLFHEEMQTARWMLARNTALIGILAFGMFLVRKSSHESMDGSDTIR